MIARLARLGALAAILVGAAPALGEAQVFLASRPHPSFTIGPLYIRASVAPDLGEPVIDIWWSLVVPPDARAAAVEGDLVLLWPSAVLPAAGLGSGDPAVVRYVEARGFVAIEDGRLALSARKMSTAGDDVSERMAGGAPFVTFVRQGGALGLTPPASYVRIPWTAKLVEPGWLMHLQFAAKGLIKPKPATWTERAFWGQRHRLLLSFQDVNARGVFPLYFERRPHVVRLAEDPAQLRIEFARADHLKIDEIAPPSSRRQLSETRDNTDVVTLYLDRSEGITPQTLSVQFGYFTGLQSWAPILIPIAFFALGNLAAPIVREVGLRLARTFRARIHVGPPEPARRLSGDAILGADVLAKIQPGQTTADDVLRLCGPCEEEERQLGASERMRLVYRGRRVIPQRKRSWGWIGTVDHWELEHQEVEITAERGVVADVQARVRRTRVTHPD